MTIQLSTKEFTWLCFNHAVKLANEGQQVDMTVRENFEYYRGDPACRVCLLEEMENKNEKGK